MSGLSAWARVGAKVVCIKSGSWSGELPGETYPRYGDVLTIRAVRRGDIDPDEHYLVFAEIRNPRNRSGNGEAQFWIERFRPVVEDQFDDEIEAQIYHKRGLHQRASRKSRADA